MTTYSTICTKLKACSMVLILLALTSIVDGSGQKSKARQNRNLPAPASHSLMSSQPSTTKWKNERGSTMVLTNEGNGRLSGEYTTAVTKCDAVKNKPQKLFGTINGTAISFTVNWGPCTSITSWVGHMDGPTKIETLWVLSIDRTDPKDFSKINAGSDVFTPNP